MSTNYDVIIAGHFARDRNVFQGKAADVPGGAVYYGGHVLGALGVRGAIVTRLAEPDRPLLDSLAERGVDVFHRTGPTTTGIENTYLDETMDRRNCVPINIGHPFRPGEFPRTSTTVVHIAPLIQGEAPGEFVLELGAWGRLGLDAQGFLRVHRNGSLRLERNRRFPEILRHAEFLKLDHAEAETLTGRSDRQSALDRILDMGVEEVVLSHAEGVTARRGGQIIDAPWTSQKLRGRTGRGDTCMAAYLACRALGLGLEHSLPLAAEVTSRKMEQPGPFSLQLDDLPPELTAPLREKLAARKYKP
jgi:sugar/nucleoside kinase (ribokinase family)